MIIFEVKSTVDCPISRVFEMFSDIRDYREAIPDIVDVEFITSERVGKGSRYVETRMQGSRKVKTELETAEYSKDEMVRFVSRSGGVIWDSIYFFKKTDEGTGVHLTMQAIPLEPSAGVMVESYRESIQSALEKDVALVMKYLLK